VLECLEEPLVTLGFESFGSTEIEYLLYGLIRSWDLGYFFLRFSEDLQFPGLNLEAMLLLSNDLSNKLEAK